MECAGFKENPANILERDKVLKSQQKNEKMYL